MTTTLSSIFARGYQALESENLGDVRAAMEAAVDAGAADDDARFGYLRFMVTWLDEASSDEELDQLFGMTGDLIEGALKLAEGAEASRIVLDVAELLAQAGEMDDAEHALRALSERDDVEPELLGLACLLRASILLDHHEDPEEALAILETVPAVLAQDPGFMSLKAACLLELGCADEAVELLQSAVERNDDVELRYQLGVSLREVEREDEAIEQLLEVRRRDLANYEVDASKPVDDDEVEDLRRRLEDVLDTLPDPVIAKVASAPIRVERWASEDIVRAGADPRSPLAFAGQPGDDDEDGELEALVVYRDAIVAQIEDDDEIVDVLALGLVEEFNRFFDLELIPG